MSALDRSWTASSGGKRTLACAGHTHSDEADLGVRQGRKRRGPHFVDAARHRVDRISGSIIRSGKGQLRQNRKLGAIVVRRSLPLIMTHRNPKIIRLATTAIAAVLALSSTQLLAQTAPEAPPPVTVAPATAAPESAPAVTISSEPLSTTASEPPAPAPTITETKSTKSTTTRRTATVARPAKAAASAAPAPVRASVAAPIAAPIAAPAETIEAAPVPVAAAPAASPPVVAATPPAQDSPVVSNMLPIAGGVGFALLALIVVGLAMRNRRRRRDEELAAAETYEPALDEAPAQAAVPATPDPLFAEPAFASLAAAPAPVVAPAPAVAVVPAAVMGAAAPAASAPTEFLPEGAEAVTAGPCADAAPGSHVEAACEGPSEDNPSLSIKKRIKRAQFFDEREQLVAAGMAVPVASDAGLPDAVETPARSTVAVGE